MKTNQENYISTAEGSSSWQFLDTIFLRSTGFPFSLISQFRFKKTWAGFEEMGKISEEIEKSAGEIVKEIRQITSAPENVQLRAKLNKARNDVDKRREIPADHVPPESKSLLPLVEKWNGAVTQLAKAAEKNRSTFESELLDKRGKLRELLQTNQAFREAMFLSSNGSSEIAVRSYLKADIQKRNTDIRQYERLFISYLQRFCTKNETTSFFGPINFGKIAPSNRNNLKIKIQNGIKDKQISRNEAFFSSWACKELSRSMSSEQGIFPYVVPKLHPYYSLSTDKLYYFGWEEKEVTPAQMKILTRIGTRNFTEIRNELKDMPEQEFWENCASLARERVISDAIMISSSSGNGVKDLLDFLLSIPDGPARNTWHENLSRLEQLRVRFSDATYSDRKEILKNTEKLFEEMTGSEAKRGTGEFFTDRSVLFEEALGTVEQLELGGSFYLELQSTLGSVLDALSLIAISKWELWQFVGLEILRQLSGDTMQVPFLECWNEFEDLYTEITNSSEYQKRQMAIKSASRCFRDAVQESGEIDHKLLISSITKILKEAQFLKQDSYPLCSSPDLLIGSSSIEHLNQGEFTIYLGEIHEQLLTTAYDNFLYFCSWRNEHVKQLHEILAKLAKPADIFLPILPRSTKLFAVRTTDNLLPLYPYNEKTTLDSLKDLYLAERNGRVVLQSAQNGQSFILPLFDALYLHPSFQILMLLSIPQIEQIPIANDIHTPRIHWCGMVYQRESWRLDENELTPLMSIAGFELFWGAYKLKKRLRYPNCVFLRHPDEPKPFFLDFENFFLIEFFQHVIRSLPSGIISEFAPNENEIWLEMNGERYCSELRTGVYKIPC